MKLDKETFLIRINRLRDRISESPFRDDLPDDVKRILLETPEMLQGIESKLLDAPIEIFNQLHQLLSQVEASVEWASGEAGGRVMVDNIKAGRIDFSHSPAKRLHQRQGEFLVNYLGSEPYLDLVREWEGEDAVQGNRVYMDPRDVDKFIQWGFHDKILPGESRRLIDIFADEIMNNLPEDEKSVLKSWQADRPSIYKVVKLRKVEPYLVRDLLDRDLILRIKDHSTSKTLQNHSIFIGRGYLIDERKNLYGLLGSITELPPKLWSIISPNIDEMSKNYYAIHPNADSQEFFRACHTSIRGLILE